MTWPASDVDTTDVDADGDSPLNARADLNDLITKFNQLRNHVTAFAQTFLDDVDAAAVRTTLGLGDAAVQNTTAFWSTGDVKITYKTVADTGWVFMNDGTIGDATSGGTTRANADTSALFTLLWNNTANAQCAVSTGRGANAAADFAAHKTIALPKTLGRALACYGSGSGLTARVLAEILGTETVTIAQANLPAVTIAVTGTIPTIYRNDAGPLNTTGNTDLVPEVSGVGGGLDVVGTTPVTGTTAALGSGTAMVSKPPETFANVMIKL